ncbi:MAG: NAD-dependent epimerase/dehydratase family protein, partial [Actinomycetota bacterium]
GSINVMEAARKNSVRRVIYASSAAVYGDHPELPKTEASPVQPLSPYAWQKLTSEFYGTAYRKLYGLEFLALRYFNVYGTRQNPDSPYSGVLSIFMDKALKEQALVIFGDGRQTRDFIDVADVVEVNRLAASASWPLPEVINVATNIETSIIDVAEMILEMTGNATDPVFEEPRKCDIVRSFADNRQLFESFDYKPQIGIHEGLAELCKAAQTSQ